ncbi:MAG: 6-carboxytetrahydropterin synthase QueD [bacterium]|nr:6-carboxytetrahydropterin synthase QueD [bacterium]
MWLVSIESKFSAAHQLKGYPGECSGVHGHNFKVKVTVEAAVLKSVGFGMDFRKLNKILNEIIKRLDHKNLNELPEFGAVNPTAENIAKLIWTELKPKIKKSIKLKEVQIWESDTNSVTYYES